MKWEGLNPEQIQAVQHIDGPMLILAGAGSGKTKTLTARLAYLIKEVGIPAPSILCLTFTNKASVEMRERAFRLIGSGDFRSGSVGSPLLCTFHKFGLLFLKEFITELGRPSSFVLLDSDDVKKIFKSFKTPYAPSILSSEISRYKNLALSPDAVEQSAKGREQRELAEIYGAYQAYLESKNLLDFDDLLYLPHQILQDSLELRERVSERYAYIMVDEYQDTNVLQYKLLRLLSCRHENLCVVGDEDQSIYGWRGADIRNILEFERDFREARVIKLEKNYRSTPQILNFANALISHNSQRLGKRLQATLQDGESVSIECFEDEKQEMLGIAREIRGLMDAGVSLDTIAILYRINALSRGVEEGLNRAKIPYRLVGAVPFYERAEVKDVLSYLRLIVNPKDDFSLFRVLNKPKRGIGKSSIEKLQALCQDASAYELLSYPSFLSSQPSSISSPAVQLPPKLALALKEFFALVDSLREALERGVEDFIRLFGESVPLLEDYAEMEREERGANIQELFALLREFFVKDLGEESGQEHHDRGLEDFLNDLSLNPTQEEAQGGKLSCMSMHSSKGLEFDFVFVVGCEEGIFPLHCDNFEEERRLGYVAFTRARKKLCLSYVRSRFYRGKRECLPASRFLREAQGQNQMELDKHSIVKHKIFGMGRVMEIIGSGEEQKARVNFGGNERVILSGFLEVME